MGREQIEIDYHPNTYEAIVKTGRLIKLDQGPPRMLEDSEAEALSERQIGPTLIFSSNYTFNTKALDNILMVHTPTEANAYWRKVKDSDLTIKFFRE